MLKITRSNRLSPGYLNVRRFGDLPISVPNDSVVYSPVCCMATFIPFSGFSGYFRNLAFTKIGEFFNESEHSIYPLHLKSIVSNFKNIMSILIYQKL